MSLPDQGSASHSNAELATFTRQLGAMLHAGVNVLRALRIASQYSGSKELIDAAAAVGRSLEDGKEFYQAISKHPGVFSAFYVEMARQGETDGTLGQALLGVADYLDHLEYGGTSPVDRPAPSAVVPAAGGSVVAGQVLGALGAFGIGAAIAGAIVVSGALDAHWLFPLTAGWGGLCFLATARKLQKAAGTLASAPEPSIVLPPKSAQRRAAETDGIVRSALQEQEEADETSPTAPPDSSPTDRPALEPEVLLPPDERVPPRFDL